MSGERELGGLEMWGDTEVEGDIKCVGTRKWEGG